MQYTWSYSSQEVWEENEGNHGQIHQEWQKAFETDPCCATTTPIQIHQLSTTGKHDSLTQQGLRQTILQEGEMQRRRSVKLTTMKPLSNKCVWVKLSEYTHSISLYTPTQTARRCLYWLMGDNSNWRDWTKGDVFLRLQQHDTLHCVWSGKKNVKPDYKLSRNCSNNYK